MSTLVTGASDDLIEIDGDIIDEFPYKNEENGDLLAFSDGTVLRIRYDNDGVWRITPVVKGRNGGDIKQAPVGDDDNYTDTATIEGPIQWVVHGMTYVKAES